MKERDSNMELLRIVAMIMVVTLHTTFLSTGTPTQLEFMDNPIISFIRVLIPSLTIIGVNLFVFISGWYGIKFSKKGLLNFLFQVLFFLLITMPAVLINEGSFSYVELLSTLTLEGDIWWFVKSYILLYIISPMLELFVETTPRQQYKRLLVGFYLFMFYWGWGVPGVDWFASGYSTISFVGLYLLARYCRIYSPKFTALHRHSYLVGYFSLSLLLTAIAVVNILFPPSKSQYSILYYYNNPVCVISALSLFLFYTKLSFKSRIVNVIASSVFSVYLIHTSKFLFPLFCITIYDFYHYHPYYLHIAFCIVIVFLVFVIGILTDQIRKLLWKKIALYL